MLFYALQLLPVQSCKVACLHTAFFAPKNATLSKNSIPLYTMTACIVHEFNPQCPFSLFIDQGHAPGTTRTSHIMMAAAYTILMSECMYANITDGCIRTPG